MNIERLIYFLLGSFTALLFTYFFIIRKFNRFINDEIEQNKAYRENAEADYNKLIESKYESESCTEMGEIE